MIFLTFVFLHLTNPSGEPILVTRDQIVTVVPAHGGDNRAKSQIIFGVGNFAYVKEEPSEIEKLATEKE